ncbi:MAG TPA: hypothetical protein GX717_05945 [Clostridiaceae bacterium]|nr:hypothetical protein [Clostridiaceae bacterium]
MQYNELRVGSNQLSQGLRGSISLLLAIFIFGIAILGGILVNLAELRNTEHQLVVAASEQTESILACYERPLFDEYGILAYRGDVPDRLGQVFSHDLIQGQVLLELEPGEALKEGPSLDGQINDFMALRLPRQSIERVMALLASWEQTDRRKIVAALGEGNFSKDTQQLAAWIQDERTDVVAGDLAADDAAPDEAASDATKLDISGENWTVEEADLINRWKRGLREDLEMQLAASDQLMDYIPDPFDVPTIRTVLTELDNWTSRQASVLGEDHIINQYVLGMFKSAPHMKDNTSSTEVSPFQYNLRNRNLSQLERQRAAEVEYILFGRDSDRQNLLKGIQFVYGLRLMIRLVDYRMSREKWSSAQSLGTLLAAVMTFVSQGSVSLSAETMTYIIWFIECSIAAFKDLKDLLFGRGVSILHYSRSDTPELYYQDYLGFLLLFINRQDKQQRLTELFETFAGYSLWTGISVRLDWQSGAPFHLQRQIALSRSYIYGKTEEREDWIHSTDMPNSFEQKEDIRSE